MLEAGEADTLCKIEESDIAQSEETFKNSIKGKAWLYNSKGNALKGFEDLPKTVAELKNQDDPYRSLAWSVENQGGFNKPCSDFGEFAWANFFRKQDLEKPTSANLDQVTKLAVKKAQSDKAKDLPGYYKAEAPRCEPSPSECEK